MTFENDNLLAELEQIRKNALENLRALDDLEKTKDADWREWANLTEIKAKSLEILEAIDKTAQAVEEKAK